MAKKLRWVFLGLIASSASLVAIAACVGEDPDLRGTSPSVDASPSSDTNTSTPDTSTTPQDAGNDVVGASNDGAADADADPGFVSGIDAPRPIAPLSTSSVTTQHPIFRFALAAGTTGARVEICKERSCTTVEQTITAQAATTAQPQILLKGGLHYWRLRGMNAAGAIGAATSATWELFVPHVEHDAGENSWGTVADFNGDGLAEVLVGTYNGVLSGRPAIAIDPGVKNGASTARVYANQPDSGFGEQFQNPVSVGDLDGDGFPELAVGSYLYLDYVDGGPPRGHVFIFKGGVSGSTSGVADYPTVEFAQPPGASGTSTTRFGAAVSAAGDVDGDGYGDFVIGASHWIDAESGGTFRGAFFLVRGHSDLKQMVLSKPIRDTSQNDNHLGSYLSAAGDVNGDGFGDVIVAGATSTAANAIYFGGGDGGLDPLRARFLTSRSPNSTTPPSPTPGDIDGDGLSDVVMGDFEAPYDGGVFGRIEIFYGEKGPAGNSTQPAATVSEVIVRPPTASNSFAQSHSFIGDTDGDGVDDLIVSAPNSPGTVHWFKGGPTKPRTTILVASPEPTTFIEANFCKWGWDVAGLGDFDGDGYFDIGVVPASGEGVFIFPGHNNSAGINPAFFYKRAAVIGGDPVLAFMWPPTTRRVAHQRRHGFLVNWL